jgi:3-phosphoshikimate 1-carboxyvinyltransferase
VILQGCSGRFIQPRESLDLGNSGTGLRLLLGLLAAQPMKVTLTGDASLSRRPVERVLAPLRTMGARAEAPGDHPPVSLTGGELCGIDYELPVPSAQMKSALLLAGVQATGETRIRGGAGSRDHTERMFPAFGVSVDTTPEGVSVIGKQSLSATHFTVPGDISAAVFYLQAAAMVPGSHITLPSVGLNPTRTGVLECFREMGLEIEVETEAGTVEPLGRLSARSSESRGISVEPAQVSGLIDELPALAVAAALARGESVFRGAGELRYKESDRLETVARGLRAIGAAVDPLEDGWRIRGSGGKPLPGGRVESLGDHRIAMAFLMAGLASEKGVEIIDSAGIKTSDPTFITNLKDMERAG